MVSLIRVSSFGCCRGFPSTPQSIFALYYVTSLIASRSYAANFKSLAKQEEGSSSSEEFFECGSSRESWESRKGTGTGTGSGERMSQDCELVHVDFEVHGRVQGVFFRKHTQEEGNRLGLRGFCRNTSAGTVSGEMEGPRPAIDKMKHWLQFTGSPMSRISSAVFKNEKVIESYTFSQGFDIKRTI